MIKIVFLLCILNKIFVDCSFEFPQEQWEIYQKGFKVSIPHIEGIKLFAFHGNLNEEMNGREAGQWARDITKARDGKWTFVDKTTTLKPDDVIYYWLYVDYDDGQHKLGYVKDDRSFKITQEAIQSGSVSGASVAPTPQPTYHPPSATPTNCESSLTKLNGKSVCKGQLIFEDNFNTLNSKKWQVEVRFPSKPDYEFCLYSEANENIAVNQNGNLKIKPTLLESRYGENFVYTSQLDLGNACTGQKGTSDCVRTPRSFNILPPIVSSRINTKESFNFVYGKVEIIAKLPEGNWLYPQLYLEPKENFYGPNYDSGSMRVAFSRGNVQYLKEVYGGVVLSSNYQNKFQYLKKYLNDENISNDFHIYKMEWLKDKILFYFDNYKYAEINPRVESFPQNLTQSDRWGTGSILAPFDKEFYLVIGLGVDGKYFPDDSQKPWKNSDPKSMYNFWEARNQWYPTWNNQKSSLIIKQIKVWAV